MQRQRRPTLEALRRARVDAGLTISGLAKRAGVSRDTISHAERGRHSLQGPTLSKIARALGRTPSELLAEEERLSPKAESRSSLEPSLFNGLEDERRETPGIEVVDTYFVPPEEGEEEDKVILKFYYVRLLEGDEPILKVMREVSPDEEATIRRHREKSGRYRE
jgi:transcriptional regulator with XRE-family HTH domain